MPVLSVKAGDVVFTSEPFSYVLCDSERGIRCDCCLQKNANLKKCIACKMIYYCDQTCQKIGWKEHKRECKFMKNCKEKSLLIDGSILIARTILKLMDPLSVKHETTPDGVGLHFTDLVSHEEDVRKDLESVKEYVCVSMFLLNFMNLNKKMSMEACFQVCCRVDMNTMNINDLGTVIAYGIYLVPSAISHSCTPNVVTNTNGTKMEVIACRNIANPSLEKLTACYVALTDPTPIRKMKLKKIYTNCNCQRCENDLLDNSLTAYHIQMARQRANHSAFQRTALRAKITELDDDSENCDVKETPHAETKGSTAKCNSKGAAIATAKTGNVKHLKKTGKISETELQTTYANLTASAFAKGATKVSMPIADAVGNEKRDNLDQLQEKVHQLEIQLLQQKLKYETELHAVSMRVEEQHIEAFKQQLAAQAAADRYSREKRVRELFPLFPLFPFLNLGMHF